MKLKYLRENKGITLLALVITIVVLLILAGITIGALSGNNSIIDQAGNAKISAEIADEKEIVEMSAVQAMGDSKNGDIKEEYLRNHLVKNAGGRSFELIEDDGAFVVVFSERSYKVDDEGNVEKYEVILDNTPGDIAKDKDGNALDGTTKPFEIWSIEDLVEFSMISNSYGGRTINTIKNKTVKVCKDLNFKSNLSYNDHTTKEYNEFLGISAELQDQIGLKEALTNETYEGFMPAKGGANFTLDGNGKVIKNIYINKAEKASLFSTGDRVTITNLEVTGKIQCAGAKCGAITAYYGTIQNCISRVNITSTGRDTGGITGGQATVSGCTNYGTITGNNYVGGVSGWNGWNTVITNCKNYGDVTGTTIVGGVYGENGKITGCENHGIITATTGGAGGIGGNNGTCTDCLNDGPVTGVSYAGGIGYVVAIQCINKGTITSDSHAAGISAGASGKAIQCINYGKIKANKSKAGGIVSQTGYVVNCINKGPVEATNNLAGGIVGYITNTSPTINCVNEGSVSAPTRVGGIVGGVDYISSDNGKVINCYNIGDLTGNTHVAETIGNKAGYGTHYVVHSYGLDRGNDNLLCGTSTSQGTLTVTDSSKYELSYMKTAPFLKLLNDYVDAYNAGETKTDSQNYDLLKWAFDEKTGCPTLVFPKENNN